jgi:putative tryptophan/tyrosine transport system substrate-binding protein
MTVLGGAAAAWPLAARAQQSAKIWRIGIIVAAIRSPAYDGFLQGMRELGYVAGKDYIVEWRFADGRFMRTAGFIEEFERLKVDVVFLGTPALVYPVRQATRTIPIVMGYSVDPVGKGFVSSLARPGGNITGLASSTIDTSPKQLELLAAFRPNLSRVALLQNPENPNYAAVLNSTQAAARKAGLALVPVDAQSPEEIEAAFAALARERIEAVMIAADGFFFTRHQRLAELALKSGLPSIFPEPEYAEAGGLMSYGESLKDFYRHAASFVDKILKGAKPGELPIEQPTQFHLVINRKTAAALGIAIPPQLHADEVIE